MQPFQKATLAVLEHERDHILDSFTKLSGSGRSMSRQEHIQLLQGLGHMLQEAAEGSAREVRDTYMTAVVIGALKHGTLPPRLMHSSAMFWAMLCVCVERHIDAEYREAAGVWMAAMTGDVVAQTADLCMQFMAGKT